ncbi:MAG: hypothetical protein ABIU54_08850 [Candidatus Eisenbacteria bacterium]
MLLVMILASLLGQPSPEVFDVSGRRLSTLFEGTSVDANTSLEWDGRVQGGGSVSPGMYICRIEQPGRRTACRFALIR